VRLGTSWVSWCLFYPQKSPQFWYASFIFLRANVSVLAASFPFHSSLGSFWYESTCAYSGPIIILHFAAAGEFAEESALLFKNSRFLFIILNWSVRRLAASPLSLFWPTILLSSRFFQRSSLYLGWINPPPKSLFFQTDLASMLSRMQFVKSASEEKYQIRFRFLISSLGSSFHVHSLLYLCRHNFRTLRCQVPSRSQSRRGEMCQKDPQAQHAVKSFKSSFPQAQDFLRFTWGQCTIHDSCFIHLPDVFLCYWHYKKMIINTSTRCHIYPMSYIFTHLPDVTSTRCPSLLLTLQEDDYFIHIDPVTHGMIHTHCVPRNLREENDEIPIVNLMSFWLMLEYLASRETTVKYTMIPYAFQIHIVSPNPSGHFPKVRWYFLLYCWPSMISFIYQAWSQIFSLSCLVPQHSHIQPSIAHRMYLDSPPQLSGQTRPVSCRQLSFCNFNYCSKVHFTISN
jgi:hypothetical protein